MHWLSSAGLALALAMLYVLYVGLQLLSGSEIVMSPAIVAQVEVNPQPAPPAADYAQIGSWHLFGQNQSAVGSEQAIISETRLQLKLLGTFVLTASPAAMTAVIQAEDGSQKKYRVGDELPGTARVSEILADRIVVTHNGRRESLTLQRLNLSLAPRPE